MAYYSEKPSWPLVNMFKTIDVTVDGLGLKESIKNHANILFKKMEDKNVGMGNYLNSILVACLYIMHVMSKDFHDR